MIIVIVETFSRAKLQTRCILVAGYVTSWRRFCDVLINCFHDPRLAAHHQCCNKFILTLRTAVTEKFGSGQVILEYIF